MEVLRRYSNHKDLVRELLEKIGKPEHGPGDGQPPQIVVRRRQQVQRRMSASACAELVRAYQGGATTYQLAETYSIRRDRVSLILERAGVARRGGGRRLEQAQ